MAVEQEIGRCEQRGVLGLGGCVGQHPAGRLRACAELGDRVVRHPGSVRAGLTPPHGSCTWQALVPPPVTESLVEPTKRFIEAVAAALDEVSDGLAGVAADRWAQDAALEAFNLVCGLVASTAGCPTTSSGRCSPPSVRCSRRAWLAHARGPPRLAAGRRPARLHRPALRAVRGAPRRRCPRRLRPRPQLLRPRRRARLRRRRRRPPHLRGRARGDRAVPRDAPRRDRGDGDEPSGTPSPSRPPGGPAATKAPASPARTRRPGRSTSCWPSSTRWSA